MNATKAVETHYFGQICQSYELKMEDFIFFSKMFENDFPEALISNLTYIDDLIHSGIIKRGDSQIAIFIDWSFTLKISDNWKEYFTETNIFKKDKKEKYDSLMKIFENLIYLAEHFKIKYGDYMEVESVYDKNFLLDLSNLINISKIYNMQYQTFSIYLNFIEKEKWRKRCGDFKIVFEASINCNKFKNYIPF